MKGIINWFKDLIYNFTDYAIILCVIVGVAAILIWRFNVLFDLKIDKDTIKPVTPPIEISDNKNDDENKDNNENNDNDENKDNEDNNTDVSDNNTGSNTTDSNQNNQAGSNDNNKDNETNNNGSTDVATGTEITFNIPAGTFPSKIADILLANGLIDDKQGFLTRCVELQLDTKLKPGDFTIKKGTSLDEIIKAIAK